MVLNTVIQCIYHNVAATILLHTGWVAELNIQVSLFNELSAEIIIASSCLKIQRNKTQHYNLNYYTLLNSLTCMYSVCFINIGDLSEATSSMI